MAYFTNMPSQHIAGGKSWRQMQNLIYIQYKGHEQGIIWNHRAASGRTKKGT